MKFKFIFRGFTEFSTRPPGESMRLPLSVKDAAPLLKVRPRKEVSAVRLLLSVAPPAPTVPKAGVSPVVGGVLAPVQLPASAQLAVPAPPVQVSVPVAARELV